jgi:hypothetical protein
VVRFRVDHRDRVLAVGEVCGPQAALDLVDQLRLPDYHAFRTVARSISASEPGGPGNSRLLSSGRCNARVRSVALRVPLVSTLASPRRIR